MNIVGTNGGVRPGYQDIASVLLREKHPLLAVEEERLNKIKHSPSKLPRDGIKWALKQSSLSFKDLDILSTHGSTWHKGYPEQLKEFYESQFGSCPPIEVWHHHQAHAASAFHASSFSSALVITMDGSGDGSSCQVWQMTKSQSKLLFDYKRPQSLGLFYSILTQFCGFTRDRDEYKLMGLSSYGNSDAYDFSDLLSWQDESYHFNQDFLVKIAEGSPQPGQQLPLYSSKLIQKLGRPRLPDAPLTKREKDIAASAQKQLELVVLKMLEFWLTKSGESQVCLAGGVALNCVLNQKIMNHEQVEDLFVQPASSDAGISLGCVYLSAIKNNIEIPKFEHVNLGPRFSNEEIKNELENLGLSYRECEDPAYEAAKRVSQSQVIGWFQGEAEFGPRALGQRSILANPCLSDIQKRVNQKIKFREDFRPFCPSVLESKSSNYFEGKKSQSPYMTITFDVNKSAQESIPGVTHIDNTARIQTVDSKTQPLYASYLKNLENFIGHPVTLNTSFNRSNEPMATNIKDAVSIFYGSGLDALVIGHFVLEKKVVK